MKFKELIGVMGIIELEKKWEMNLGFINAETMERVEQKITIGDALIKYADRIVCCLHEYSFKKIDVTLYV